MKTSLVTRGLTALAGVGVLFCFATRGEAKPNPWKLSGDEVLLEISSSNEKYPSGIYAVNLADVKWGDDIPIQTVEPKLLLEGGRRPNWGPHHVMFSYLRDGSVCVGNKDGVIKAVCPALPVNMMPANEPVLRWDWSGIGYAISRSETWGSRVSIGGIDDKYPLAELTKPEGIWSSSFMAAILPLKKPAEPTEFLDWRDVLTTNAATFSPDGRKMAAEVYPAGPYDVHRGESRIRIFEYFPWAGPNPPEKLNLDRNKTEMDENRKWFFPNGVLSGIRPSKVELKGAPGEVQLTPFWSPDGRWIAYTRLSSTSQGIAPCIADANAPEAEPVSLGFGVVDATVVPTWGVQSATVLGWSANGRLWMIDGKRAELRTATRENGEWRMKPVQGDYSYGLGINLLAFRDDKVVYTGDRIVTEERIYWSDAKNPGETKLFPLPAGLIVTGMSW